MATNGRGPRVPRVRRVPSRSRGAVPGPEPDVDTRYPPAAHAPPHVQALLALQSRAGNLAVSRLVAGQVSQQDDTGAGGPDRPVAPSTPDPQEHAGFVAVTERLDAARRRASRHEPAKASAAKAQGAAKPPLQDKLGQAKYAKAAEMEAAKPNPFNKQAFVAAVNAALAKQKPKNLSEAMSYKESGKADAVRTQIMGEVGKSKDESARPVTASKDKPPDLSVAVEKKVTPLPGLQPAGPVHPLGAQQAMPPPAPAEQLDLSRGPREVDDQLRQGEVTEQQLADSNEPEFQATLDAKREAEQHSATAPGEVRQHEADTLSAARPAAAEAGQVGSTAMTGARRHALRQVAGHQSAAKAQDEARRAEVTQHVNQIFDTTKGDVDEILKNLDAQVDKDFTAGEQVVKEAFTADLEARMDAYKDDRYSGLRGKARWIRDKFKGLPESANEVYVAARATYETRMQVLIGQIADTVARELNRAKQRVTAGRTELATYVDSLPRNLKAVGSAAAEKIGNQLDELDSAVDDKGQELADDLATKYTESRKDVDEQITAMQEANKGLIAKVKDLVVGVIKVIGELKDLLVNVLTRVAGAVSGIIAHPIRFLGNLVDGVKTGVSNFADHIGDHLKQGLKDWLFGHLEGSGVELPDELDAQGVITMLLSIAGLTQKAIMERIRAKVPEPVLDAVAKTVEFVQLVRDQGLGGIYHLVVAKIGDVSKTLKDKAEDFIVTKIIRAGVTWILSLLNPASAFIKACKAIINVIGFFFGNLDRIKEFVNSVLDSVENFIAGDVSGAAKKIEDALVRTVPIVIGFLANLLDLGDVGETIRGIVSTVRKPVEKVVDGLINLALKVARPFVRAYERGARTFAAAKAKVAQVKGKVTDVAKRLGASWLASFGRKRFTMRGHQHSLYLELRGGSPVVMMASGADAALAKIAIGLNNPAVQASRKDKDNLELARSKVTRLHENLVFASKISSTPAMNKAQFELNEALVEVAKLLRRVGEKFDIDELSGTHYTEGGMIRPEFDIRAEFYQGNYRKHRGAKLLAAHDDKRAREAELRLKYPQSFDRMDYECPGVPGLTLPHLDRDARGQVDHILAVADHWNQDGHNWNQDDRNTWYVDPLNLQILCEDCNRLKDATKRTNPKVGPNFSGRKGQI